MTACSMQRQLTCFSTLFHVKHSDDVTSDDFYMTPDNISDDTRAGDAAPTDGSTPYYSSPPICWDARQAGH